MAGFRKGNTKSKKKKGPKGKKLRAKAKLDRQWGEERQEETVLRRGKSRLLSSAATRQDDDDDLDENVPRDTVSSDDDDDSGTEQQPAYNSLLHAIRQKSSQHRHDDAASSDESSSDDDASMQDVEASDDENDDDDNVDSSELSLKVDLHTDRFGPHPEGHSPHQQRNNNDNNKNHKVKLTLSEHGLSEEDVEVQHTEGLLKQLASHTTLQQKDPQRLPWKPLARAHFNSTRQALQNRWRHINNTINNKPHPFSKQQTLLYPFLSSYTDVLCMTAQHKPERQSTERLAAYHVLNHVWTSRNRVQRHNRQIKDLETATTTTAANDNDDRFRDQGFARPTALILLPTRGACYQFVTEYLLPLLGDDPFVDKRERFEEEYGKPPEDDDDEEEKDPDKERRRQKVLSKKGTDWLDLFGDDVNTDDDFRLALALHPKGDGKRRQEDFEGNSHNVGIRLFTDFYRSDIIIASPLGLKMTATSADETTMQADFLSSIEICLVTRADVLSMQNWDHVNDVLSLLNQSPKNTNETDFSRVRPYFLDGQAAPYRQLVVLAPFVDPFLVSTFKRHATSQTGQVWIRRRVPEDEAALTQVVLPTRQVFQREPCKAAANQTDDRLQYFLHQVLSILNKPSNKQMHTLIYIPSYFDYVAVRNALLKRELEHYFVSVTEYARPTEVSRGRARFLQGRRNWMLYTGRAHFFLRHDIRGARQVIFFGLPEHIESQ